MATNQWFKSFVRDLCVSYYQLNVAPSLTQETLLYTLIDALINRYFSVFHFGGGFSTAKEAKNEKLNSHLFHFWVACRQRRPYPMTTTLHMLRRRTGVREEVTSTLPPSSRKIRTMLHPQPPLSVDLKILQLPVPAHHLCGEG